MLKRQLAIVMHFIIAVTLVIAMLVMGSVVSGQEPMGTAKGTQVANNNDRPATEKPAEELTEIKPVYTNFMGVSLGMKADEVREKLGKLKDKGQKQDFFVFSADKSAQVFYDSNSIVIAFSVDYVGNDSGAPSSEEVLGHAVQPKADGSLYQLERYPEAGYWVSYSRTSGNNPITSVTVQKF